MRYPTQRIVNIYILKTEELEIWPLSGTCRVIALTWGMTWQFDTTNKAMQPRFDAAWKCPEIGTML